MKIIVSIILFVQACIAQPMPPALTNGIKSVLPPKTLVAVTNITLSWPVCTSVWYRVEGTTNFTTWYFVTNVSIDKTNVILPVTKPNEFFRYSIPFTIN